MKFIYYINNIFFGLTLLGYLTIIYGMYLQILLGCIQLLFFIVLLFNYHKFSQRIKEHLTTYGILTSFFLLWFFLNNHTLGITILFIMIAPMLIATYFTYIVYQLNQKVL
ncbi:hypothetical protein H2O64_13715 [Kordia sp. YSTF-M3]|uniref:Uncharacterized protein n=1 Tax=Kordia aestuariivivens TaxID=2759037 RepID=A0ABR7QB55_9FLAO|nr:hypothetical protein [Kordia aestuariivivens]MBC8755728.1 hypothetical protein [Kordia aestuariivivens]